MRGRRRRGGTGFVEDGSPVPEPALMEASFHWSALDTEKERWCMPSLLPPKPARPPPTDTPDWRDVLLLE